MTSTHFWGVLILTLGLALCVPAEAQTSFGPIGGVGTGTIVGVIVGVAAGVVVIAIVAIHYSKKRTITGCVRPAQNGMTVNDEKDKLVYALSGDTAGVKPGQRMTLQGKKIKPKAGNPLAWDVRKIRTDYGVCQP
jgi:hypothetical protein